MGAAPKYDDLFYEAIAQGSYRSAKLVCSYLRSLLTVKSVLDVGCGTGEWLGAWRDLGVADIFGLDGDYVNRRLLKIPNECFRAHDLTKPFNLNRQFDLVQSLEVAEHLPPETADMFVRHLVSHGDIVLFSAAVPGQTGENHINEQPYEYWRARFAEHGYRVYDPIRKHFVGDKRIDLWYRCNALVYASPKVASQLPESIRTREISTNASIPDVSPWHWRVWKSIFKNLPQRAGIYVTQFFMKIATLSLRVRRYFETNP